MRVPTYSILYFGLAASSQFDPRSYATEDVIVRDVAVIGGGSSGTYGAVNLQRLGKSVVLVEKEACLGGHVNSYTDPATRTSLDYGVQTFWNITTTHDYFEYLDIPVSVWTVDNLTNIYADFTRGDALNISVGEDYTVYVEQLNKYPYIEWSWDLPNPVPSDLLLPFSEFVEKYSLQDLAYSVYFNAQGTTNFLNQLTVNVFKYVDDSFLDALSGGDVVTSDHNNWGIFAKALALLGSDVLLSSTVVSAQRSTNGTGVSLVVQTPTGNKLIQASQLLISIPPLLENMQPFNLSTEESDLFSQWDYGAYYTMLINNTGLPAGYRFINAVADFTTDFNIPTLPAPYQVTESRVPGLFYVWYASPYVQTQAEVEAAVSEVVQRLQVTANGNSTTTHAPTFVEFRSHTPFKLVVSADVIEDGFYSKLEALQGQQNTWYTGAAFLSHSSGILWNFTASLLPEIISAIESS